MTDIVRATEEHHDEVARLFDLYRQFYECQPDLDLARSYIADRMAADESMIWVALDGDRGCGMVQCYRSFCSVEALKRWILYDLYVEPEVRSTGIGRRLMAAAHEAAWADGAKRVDLETAVDNFAGQHLYDKLGYEPTPGFLTYSLARPRE